MPIKYDIAERQVFKHLTPQITLASVMSPEEGYTLNSVTIKGNQSSPRVFRTAQQLTFVKIK